MGRPKQIHGWVDGGKVALSLSPKVANGPRNLYDDVTAALREASSRKLPIVWEDPAAIDALVGKGA